MDKRISIFKVLRQDKQLTRVLVYCAKETVNDPYEKTTTKTFNNPITIDALVRDVSTESLVWKYYGQIPIGSKSLICEKKHLNLLKSADKIKIGDNYYKVRKDDSKGWAIQERADYLIVVTELKNL